MDGNNKRPGQRPGQRPIERSGQRPVSRPGQRPVQRTGTRPRTMTSQGSGPRRRPRLVVKQKKKSMRFKLGFLIYILLMLFAILIVDVILWGKLAAYEKSENKKSAAESSSNKVVKVVTGTPVPTEEPDPTMSPTPTPIPEEEIVLRAPEQYQLLSDNKLASAVSEKDYDDGSLDTLKPFLENYSEYAQIKTTVDIPKLKETVYKLPVGAVLSFEDGDGNKVTPEEKEEDGRKVYTIPLKSDDSYKDDVTTRAFEFLVHYSLFCAGDETTSPLVQYFPKNSEYLKLIKKTDNGWYNKHRGLPTYKNKTVNEFFGYGDSLCYMDLSMTQTILAVANGKYLDYDINMGIWMCKMNGTWMISGMVYKEM